MKKIYLIPLLFLCLNLSLYSQEYQRMLILPNQFTGIIGNGKSADLKTICLDLQRDAPIEGLGLNHLLTNTSSTFVEFSDGKTPKFIPLNSLLGNGISIVGRGGTDYIQIINNTNRPFKLNINEGIQVSNKLQPAAKVRSTDQIKQWEPEIKQWESEIIQEQLKVQEQELKQQLEQEKALGRLENKYSNKIRAIGYDNIYALKQDYYSKSVQELSSIIEKEYYHLVQLEKTHLNKLRKIGFSRLQDYISEFGLKVADAEDNLIKDYNALIEEEKAEQLRIARETEINAHFKKHNIGIKGSNAFELLSKYQQAQGKELSWDEIKLKVEADFKNNIQYVFENNKYFRYIKSPSIRGKNGEYFLYKYSDFTMRHLKQLEKSLSEKAINPDNIHIVNFLHKDEDKATYEALGKFFQNKFSDFSAQSIKKLMGTIKEKKTKYLFCLGHYGDGKIFTIVNGIKHEYDTKMLDGLAKKLGVEVIYLGCKSSFSTKDGVGTMSNVNSIDLINNVFESLNHSKTYAEFFSNLDGANSFEFDERTGLIKITFTKAKEKSKQDQSKTTQNLQNKEKQYKPSQMVFTFPLKLLNPSLLNAIYHQQTQDDDDKPAKN